jgi:polygalacturonase
MHNSPLSRLGFAGGRWRLVAVTIFIAAAGVTASPIAPALVRYPAVTASPRTASSFSDSACAATGATARRVFRPTVLANGTTDNTDVIQRSIDAAAAAGGGIVSLPVGTFVVDGHLQLRSNVELRGAGPATVLKAGPAFLDSTGPEGGYPVITTAGASNVTIADLTANQNGLVLNGNANPGQRLAGYLIDVRDSRNAVVENVATRNPFTYSIAVVGSRDFCVRHCNTQETSSGRYTGLDGIHILDSNTGQVIDNHVDQRLGLDGDDGLVAHTISAPVYDVLYANNNVRGGNLGDGMQIAVGNYPVYDVTIRDNNFWGSPYGIRTGYYSTGVNGVVRNITITQNDIHNLVPGEAFPDGGNAIDIGGFGAVAPVSDIVVTGNRICAAGQIIVPPGNGDVVARNRFCAS